MDSSAVAVSILTKILDALAGTRVMLRGGIMLIRYFVALTRTLMIIKLASETWLP